MRLCVWDVPSGTLLHSRGYRNFLVTFRWSCTDQYLLFQQHGEMPRYLNADTFQLEEVLEQPGNRFPNNHFYYDRYRGTLRICEEKEPLFLALPSTLVIADFISRGDRIGILGQDRKPLLLDTSGLEAYMEQYLSPCA